MYCPGEERPKNICFVWISFTSLFIFIDVTCDVRCPGEERSKERDERAGSQEGNSAGQYSRRLTQVMRFRKTEGCFGVMGFVSFFVYFVVGFGWEGGIGRGACLLHCPFNLFFSPRNCNVSDIFWEKTELYDEFVHCVYNVLIYA